MEIPVESLRLCLWLCLCAVQSFKQKIQVHTKIVAVEYQIITATIKSVLCWGTWGSDIVALQMQMTMTKKPQINSFHVPCCWWNQRLTTSCQEQQHQHSNSHSSNSNSNCNDCCLLQVRKHFGKRLSGDLQKFIGLKANGRCQLIRHQSPQSPQSDVVVDLSKLLTSRARHAI